MEKHYNIAHPLVKKEDAGYKAMQSLCCYDDADIAKCKAGAFGAKTGKKRAK